MCVNLTFKEMPNTDKRVRSREYAHKTTSMQKTFLFSAKFLWDEQHTNQVY